ncbi:solute carrier family 22 member 21 [Elysia marginata]|uniref:Solute carrier family 22 member 21 n=1 Tax=Elysia marginata TaxID=1093978 RepID=A0AAV4HFV3_9GAST|nr:solute carrier family 22 member 21 [Elysia marginata]
MVIEYYPIELMPTRWRHIVAFIPSWGLGMMAFAGTAYWLEDWSHLHIATAVLGATMLLGYFYMPESPRWLATQGRINESLAVLEKMARTNGKPLPPWALRVVERIANDKKRVDQGKKYTYLDLFKTKQGIKITLIFGFQWVTLAVTYYGINFAVSSFAGNLYLNMFLMSVVQIPSYVVTFFVVSRLGRRLTCLVYMSILMMVGVTCVCLHLAAPEHVRDLIIGKLCLVASLVSVSCWAASEIWVTESYPTVTRTLGFGFASLSARVASVLAPFLINLVSPAKSGADSFGFQ